ncbi:hypothetical protein Vadar_033797 [Vaccinium darrowii]|uniref:Uncharacterized protein n=1 Tax=Vaccinium darrowii TaxID=229202 RepID=A0ACB7Y569_9ERIC|nr:hypothetical protein Vadar_033797 [Vaccinium darrowii]
MVKEKVVVGFEEEVERLLEKLGDGGVGKSLEIISLIGAGGGGKTTLARKVYDHPFTSYTFEIRAWIYISQDYHRTKKRDLLIGILESVNPGNYENRSDDKLGEDILKCLKGRKYFIVMDDIWGIEAWNDIQRSFPKEWNGSKVLFTNHASTFTLYRIDNKILCEDNLINRRLERNIPTPPDTFSILSVTCHITTYLHQGPDHQGPRLQLFLRLPASSDLVEGIPDPSAWILKTLQWTRWYPNLLIRAGCPPRGILAAEGITNKKPVTVAQVRASSGCLVGNGGAEICQKQRKQKDNNLSSSSLSNKDRPVTSEPWARGQVGHHVSPRGVLLPMVMMACLNHRRDSLRVRTAGISSRRPFSVYNVVAGSPFLQAFSAPFLASFSAGAFNRRDLALFPGMEELSSRTELDSFGAIDPRATERIVALSRSVMLYVSSARGESGTFLTRRPFDSNDLAKENQGKGEGEHGFGETAAGTQPAVTSNPLAQGADTYASAPSSSSTWQKAPADPDIIQLLAVGMPPSPYVHYVSGNPREMEEFRIIYLVIVLVKRNNLQLSKPELMLMYNMGHNLSHSRYFFSTRLGFDHVVSRLTDTDKWVVEHVKVSDNFEFGPTDMQFDWLLRDPNDPCRDPIPRFRGTPRLRAGRSWNRLIALLSCPGRDAPSLQGYEPKYKGFAAQKLRTLVAAVPVDPMAPRCNLRAILKEKEEQAQLLSAAAATTTATTRGGCKPISSFHRPTPRPPLLTSQALLTGGRRWRSRPRRGSAPKRRTHVIVEEGADDVATEVHPFALIVEKPRGGGGGGGGILTAEDSLDEDVTLGRAVLGMTSLLKDMASLPHSRAESNTLFFFHMVTVELLNSWANWRKKSKDNADKANAAEVRAQTAKETAASVETQVLDLNKLTEVAEQRATEVEKKAADAEEENRKLTADLAVAEVEKKRAADELEQLKAGLPKMLTDAEAKGAAQAGEEYADELEEIKAEAEVKIARDTSGLLHSGYNVGLDVFDLLADDPCREPPAVLALVLSLHLAEATKRLDKAERQARVAVGQTSTPAVDA